MKRIDRMLVVLSILFVKFSIIYGALFYLNAGSLIVTYVSIFGLLLLVFYFFGEIIAVEMNETLEQKKVQELQKKEFREKRKVQDQGLAGFRKLFGGEEHEN